MKKISNTEIFSFVFHYSFPALFLTGVQNFFNEKTDKTKEKLTGIFQEVERFKERLCFQVMLISLSSLCFREKNLLQMKKEFYALRVN